MATPMRIEEAKYSIIEIADWVRKRELTVNKEYQRASGLWPPNAKSYFIDTILKGFPFRRSTSTRRSIRNSRNRSAK
jgi:hypothetical protein